MITGGLRGHGKNARVRLEQCRSGHRRASEPRALRHESRCVWGRRETGERGVMERAGGVWSIGGLTGCGRQEAGGSQQGVVNRITGDGARGWPSTIGMSGSPCGEGVESQWVLRCYGATWMERRSDGAVRWRGGWTGRGGRSGMATGMCGWPARRVR